MLMLRQFTFNPIQENTYVVYNGQGECCIVDPGCYFPAERNELKEFIDENRLVPKYLLNTHCHLDHVFGNKFVHETWGLELYTHELEKPVLEYAPISGKSWGIPFDNYSGPLHWLNADDEVAIGNDRLKVLFTPGHSPGHISFYSAMDEFVLSGDVLFRGSIGRTDLPGGNFETLIRSVREQIFVLPDNTRVYSGHGESTFVGVEKRENPYFQR